MKHFFLFLLLLLSWSAQAVPLTFRVDMSQQAVVAAGVHVAGNFQTAAGFAADWDPASTLLTDTDKDQIYEVTVEVPAGVYLYKFVNGNSWDGAELPSSTCGVTDGGGNVNRQVSLSATGLRLPSVAFGDCNTQVRFAVNMRGQTVSRAGVHVTGNFQTLAGYGSNWDPTSIALRDDNGDGIYEVQLSLPAASRFEYRFVNGDTNSSAEIVPAACGTADGNGTLSRVLDATGAVNTTPEVCYSTCQACGSSPTEYSTHWWNDAVFYEVFVRSFYDSNGDGQGDFAGLTKKLDYLNDGDPATTTDLGITGIWLMPMMESPSYHGYDVTNYKATEPDYGTMAEFETFLAAAHARGIKVIIDFVLNHTSSQHPWFTQSASSATNAYRDWYRWSSTFPGTGPGGSTVWHPLNSSYYYGSFWSGMPDLNWRNAEMKATMWDISRFWLNKGVDGFRLDAIKLLVEDGATYENTPGTLAVLEEFHDTITQIKPDVFTVGEAWSPTAAVVPYVVNDRLNTCFEFELASATLTALNTGSANALRNQLNLVNQSYPKLQYATFLTNHDQNRVLGTLGSNMARMKQAAMLYLTMPGVPFLYYGEEVGMLGEGADENKRRPMQWANSLNGGFSTGTPWRALNSNYAQFNVATMQTDPASLLNHYKKLIALRNSHEVLRKGYYLPTTTSSDASVLGYGRILGSEAVLIIANISASSVANMKISLAVSSLPAGTYQASDLYTGKAAGTIVLNGQGGFSNWAVPLTSLGANQTWMLHLEPSQPTAAIGQRALLQMRLFPNPASNQVTLELAQASKVPSQLTVYDLQGRIIQTGYFSGRRHLLTTSTWANGSYFLRVQSDQNIYIQRVVITH
ncbi:alpha-amylase family glycosyl hydrolase [Hymenobacter sp. BT730]|uniref:alpha-amylase family glycosyl hydrolase n=1 Tax=Hymenobacter sp. BT730 TaxID=3063332 RepID=UPI0026DEE9FF|nr:alpha-amylase family glycosyl hydrolase [Hymenobacter sp. BT730]